MSGKYYNSFKQNILKNIFINFLVVLAFSGFFPKSLYIENIFYGFCGSLLITLFYKFIRPVFLFFSIIPIILTFGVFIFVVNTLIILVVSNILSPYFHINSFLSAFCLAIFISIFNLFIGGNDKKIIIKRFK